jgi:hypothetical protein
MSNPVNPELYNPDLIREKLAKGLVRSSHLLATSRFLQSNVNQSPEYQDPTYFPFYFYLGQQLQSENILQIGSRLGLVGACFLQGCRTVENWLSIDVPINEHKHLAGLVKGNIQRHCGGLVNVMYMDAKAEILLEGVSRNNNSDYSVDTVFVSEKFDPSVFKAALDFGWYSLKSGGILIADYISSDELLPVFTSFCRVKNRESLNFETRYGVGIVRR